MSGGVDSSIAALLLKKQGYHVTGAHFILAKSQAKDVKEICRKLNIPLYIWNFRQEFKKNIICDFISQYKKGLTPNPCVFCNRRVKLGLFYEKAKKAGADFIATGHYVRNIRQNHHYILKKGFDAEKDQSYFLWDIKPEVMLHCLFPLGNLTKEKVKRLAAKYCLSVAKSESQEICFISGKIGNFLKKKIKSRKGLIKDFKSKKIIGNQRGLFFYTIGQRSGLGLPGGPWYVLKKEVKKNILWVTNNSSDLLNKEISVCKINWLVKPKRLPVKVTVKPRYRHLGAKAKIIKIGKYYKIIFNKPERALTPGQSAVFYQGKTLLGGGIIL